MMEANDRLQDDPQFSDGYKAYQQGRMIPTGTVHARFTEGWWAARDADEKFGSHESFLQSPEPPNRWDGDDAPENDREERIYRRGWNDALRWSFP